MNELCMLDLVARARSPVGAERGLEGIQCDAVGAVADGVQGNLESRGVALYHHLS